MNAKFYTYVLFSVSHSGFYIGQTDTILSRIERHNNGFVKSTKPYKPWEIVGYIEKTTRKEAMLLEKKLKNLNTEDLKIFIEKYFNKKI